MYALALLKQPLKNTAILSFTQIWSTRTRVVYNSSVLEPHCDRAAWVRSRFEPQELIDVQLERQLATRYQHGVVFASTKLLYTTSFYQSLGFIAAKYRIEFLFEVYE